MENKILPWPLMKDCITEEDKQSLVDFIQTSNRYTNGPKVKQLEQEWSEWLGVRHSLFVSSGSTANFLLLSAIKRRYNLKKGDKVLVPAMTWVTNVAPIIQLGLKPNFKVKNNPLGWVDWIINGDSFKNFFEGTVTDYNADGMSGDDWGWEKI